MAWGNYLRHFHRQHPRVTQEALEQFVTEDGKNSYLLLTECLNELASDSRPLKVLDLGCGDGRLTEEILRRPTFEISVSGLDLLDVEISRT
jgi:2-polyprenyl-3-methyl-5-hydroxy-6-metoxy-1,4-benzoquinol methylase